MDTAHVFDVARALEQPRSLDESKDMELGDSFVEIHSAAFGERGTLVLECSGLEGEEISLPDGQSKGSVGLAV
ncbi:hypothetical protein D187_005707 [Cystobacter fuscus DSM 2262]|uniref:Uncharacterized protein n=1 Tax=Cystobacter fuscus (strain ATCC 25194 / DSM 2262 / NBRC 100088 / M29) TaxID=1242864 RepID=S9PJQ8_CYSF2|nr:hypothetical protein [Cystobacter fuscus]EPX63301.1 hypothetical protein D187_005707 [Cystobacter fuscus DSM 2262]